MAKQKGTYFSVSPFENMLSCIHINITYLAVTYDDDVCE